MEISLKKFLVLIFLGSSSLLPAEVFTLAPFRGKSDGPVGAADIFKAVNGAELWSEPVVVNGIRTQMNLRLLKNDIKECFLTFKQHFPGCVFRSSPGALMVEFKLKDGTLERLYLVQMGGAYPVLQFAMTFPGGIPEHKREWPEELPITRVAEVENTISLTERNVTFGSFSTSLSGDAAMNEIRTDLAAKGWTDLKQGVFIKDNPLSIMLVSFSGTEKGVTHGFILKRPFKVE